MHIINAIVTIAVVPAPAQIMIIGPSAIFGKALSTTRYGSATARAVSLHHKATAMITPAAVEITKPSMHS